MSEDRLQGGRDYVAKLRAQGRSDEQIREGLQASGWGERDIEALIGAPGPVPPPAPRAARERRTDSERPGWSLEDQVPEGYTAHGVSEAMRLKVAAARREEVKRPGELTFFIVLVDVVAILGLLLAAMVMRDAGREAGPGMAGAVILGLGLLMGLTYLGVLAVGPLLWNGANRARITMMVLMGLAILQSLPFNPAQGGQSGVMAIVPWLFILIAALFIVVLNKGNVKAYCSA